MSVHVTSWVLRHSPATLGDRLVLLVLADKADEDGTNAWPSVATIANESRLSERQAQRCLRNLEQTGQIVRHGRHRNGNQRHGTYVYDVVMTVPKGDILSVKGDIHDAQRVTPMSPDPSLEPPKEQLLAAAPQNGVRKGRVRNDIWDTLDHIFGPAQTRTEQTKRGKVVASLRTAGATPEEIMARSKRWPLWFDQAAFTETALEAHWSKLARKPLRRTG